MYKTPQHLKVFYHNSRFIRIIRAFHDFSFLEFCGKNEFFFVYIIINAYWQFGRRMVKWYRQKYTLCLFCEAISHGEAYRMRGLYLYKSRPMINAAVGWLKRRKSRPPKKRWVMMHLTTVWTSIVRSSRLACAGGSGVSAIRSHAHKEVRVWETSIRHSVQIRFRQIRAGARPF